MRRTGCATLAASALSIAKITTTSVAGRRKALTVLSTSLVRSSNDRPSSNQKSTEHETATIVASSSVRSRRERLPRRGWLEANSTNIAPATR